MPRPPAKKSKATGRITGSGAYKRATPGKVRGRGAYSYDKPGPWGAIGRQIGAQVARAMGMPAGLGEAAGGLAHYAGRVFGSGAYKTNAQTRYNSLFQAGRDTSLHFGNRGEQAVRVKHREYIGDLFSPSTAGDTVVHAYSLNPGDEITFPWLCRLANNFSQYKLHGCVFEYRSTCADALNSTNTALGSISIAANYNVLDRDWTTKTDVMNSMSSATGKTSDSIAFGIECDSKMLPQSQLYIRSNGIVQNDRISDPRLTDLCKLFVMVTGLQGTNVNLGQLWITYDVELIMPIGSVDNEEIEAMAVRPLVANVSSANLFFEGWQAWKNDMQSDTYVGSFDTGYPAHPVIFEETASYEYLYFPRGCAGKTYRFTATFIGSDTSNLVAPTYTYGGGLVADNIRLYLPSPSDVNTGSNTLNLDFIVSMPDTVNQQPPYDNPNTSNWPHLRFEKSTATLPSSLTAVWYLFMEINTAFDSI
nr:MAG: putative capsid protein [Arizlama virus]